MRVFEETSPPPAQPPGPPQAPRVTFDERFSQTREPPAKPRLLARQDFRPGNQLTSACPKQTGKHCDIRKRHRPRARLAGFHADKEIPETRLAREFREIPTLPLSYFADRHQERRSRGHRITFPPQPRAVLGRINHCVFQVDLMVVRREVRQGSIACQTLLSRRSRRWGERCAGCARSGRRTNLT